MRRLHLGLVLQEDLAREVGLRVRRIVRGRRHSLLEGSPGEQVSDAVGVQLHQGIRHRREGEEGHRSLREVDSLGIRTYRSLCCVLVVVVSWTLDDEQRHRC